MTNDEIFHLFKLLKSKRIIEMSEWIMGSCPFAKYLHTKRTDNRPSFGIRKGTVNTYNCFSCGSKGIIELLPTNLEFMSNESYQHIREFIQFSTVVLQAGGDFDKPIQKTLKEIPINVYHEYPVMKQWNGITDRDIRLWDLRYDDKYNRILYPIFTREGKLVGIRGRNLVTKCFISYTHLVADSLDPKSCGLWFGMQFPLVANKALILVEGERDAILLKRYASNVWASMGASISQKQVETIKQLNIPVIIFLDNDQAGEEGKSRLLRSIEGCRTIKEFYGCKDPAEAVERNVITKILSRNNLLGG